MKVLRTAEFVPYVVFIEAPGPERLRAMNRAALESGVATKQLTVGARGDGETEAGSGSRRRTQPAMGVPLPSPWSDGETEAGFGVQEADAQRTVEESSRIQRGYGHYFDLSLTNDDLERTFGRLREAMDHLRVQPQWVPVTWVY